MSPSAVTPQSSGTSTPTTASALTQAGIKHNPATTVAPLDASNIKVELTKSPRPVPAPDSPELISQKICTDHMIMASWTEKEGWGVPELKPYGPLEIMPTASVLHYATECFEGSKLYRGYDGKLRLFRVSRNCQRMQRSSARIALPEADPVELQKMIVALCARDGPKWLPKERPGSFLYLRPTMIANDETLGVQRPKKALLFIILACFPDLTKSAAAPAPPALNGGVTASNGVKQGTGLKLLASNEDTVRAWPGGFGFAKVGANYGPSLVAQGEARARGFDQVLWLFGQENYVTEAGASNFFVVLRSKETGKKQLITAPLTEQIILEGITRASVLDLARERLGANPPEGFDPLEVVERRITMAELMEAHAENRFLEAFAAGTAFFIAQVSMIHFRGKDIELDNSTAVYAQKIKQWLMDIMYGKVAHEWGVVVDEVDA